MTAIWTNDDGLTIRYGLEEGEKGHGGAISTFGPSHVISLDLTYEDFPVADTILDENIFLPTGALVEKVEIICLEAFESQGDGFTFDIGLFKKSDRTALDADGLVDGAAQAIVDAVGELTTYTVSGSGAAGDLVGGIALTEAAYISTIYGTAAPTDGRMLVRIYYHKP